MKSFDRIWIVLLVVLVSSCGARQAKDKVNALPAIFPDYTDVTIPKNIAPLNFEIKGATHIQATFEAGGKQWIEASGDDRIEIPISSWRTMLAQMKGKELDVTVSVWTKEHPDGVEYKPFTIKIADSDIDPWIAYRLIPPGYEEWHTMGIYQRDITSFDQEAIITNSENHKGCVNCHSFAQYSPEKLVFHARGKNGGTIVYSDGQLNKIDLGSMGPQKSGTYPFWHPSGKYIAFSSNMTRQSFYGHSRDKIEVYDLKSDIIIYDVIHNRVLADERFNDSINWETFPSFSPDGKYLYFCTARGKFMPTDYSHLKYSICRVPFNEADGSLGAKLDTVYSASRQGGSCSFPRISPDGKYLLFTLAACATFPIHHKEADLKLIDLQTGALINTDKINSRDVDSYHSWSHNGQWIIFSSKRIDGRYTRLFITYFKDGTFSKPFLLPQKDPEYNQRLLYSYNIPEFIKGKVRISKDKMSSLFYE